MTSTLQKSTGIEPYLASFNDLEGELSAIGGPAIQRLRRAAIARFGEIGFPGPRDEDWKFTSVAPIVRANLTAVASGASLRPTILHGKLPAGVQVMSLADAVVKSPQQVEAHLGQHLDHRQHAFAALNTALWRDGVFIHVPRGVAVEEPITLDWTVPTDAQPGQVWYRRVLVVLEESSELTLAETFSGPNAVYATNGVSEIVLGANARLDHYKANEESLQAFHLASTQVIAARDSRFSTHYIGLGGSLVRNEVRVLFTGENAEATVNGLYRGSGSQHHDNHTVIDHAQPRCNSHELYKGILDDRSRGVFNGKIFVRLDAQKTDAKQTNQTLLLSDEATINTKPQLEIFADDVKCTHGATVGQLDEQQLYYLRSRGIGAEQARAVLTFAFANDIISRIKVPALHDRLERALLASSHLPRLADLEVE